MPSSFGLLLACARPPPPPRRLAWPTASTAVAVTVRPVSPPLPYALFFGPDHFFVAVRFFL